MDHGSGAQPAPRLPPLVEGLFPAYFALVMATGIIAVGCAQQGITLVAEVLWAIAAVAYVVLWILLVLRIVRFPRAVARDLTQHARGFQFLTIVAATNILGGAAAAVHGWWGLTWVLWWASLPLWAGILYPALIAFVPAGRSSTCRSGSTGRGSSSRCRPSPSPWSAPCCSPARTST